MTASPPPVPPGAPVAGSWRPFAWCNLARNPFGELTREERMAVAVVDVETVASQLQRPWSAVQWIGECGRGKTTHLLALAARLPDASYVYLDEEGPCPPIPDGRPVMIDEAQRLPRRVRRRVFASGLPLVLATHRSLHRGLTRAGYEVRTERVGEHVTPELVQAIVRRRIEWCRLAPGPTPSLSREEADRLVNRFGSDLRAMEGFLYERVQQQAFSDGELQFID